MLFNSPILYIVYNRLDKVKLTFERIKEVKPKNLYIIADGPKDEIDKVKCDAVKSYISDNIDWSCKVSTLFRDKNLGCKEAVKTGIDWFFKHVEEGIILEDDTLANHSFFYFCQELLEKYRYEKKIYSIGGTNIFQSWPIKESYVFSMQGSIWGWATWKRAWKNYIEAIEINEEHIKLIKKYSKYNKVIESRLNNFNKVYKQNLDTWDYQWIFTRIVNNGYCIIPSNNLISNIGFGANATHTINKSTLSNIRTIPLNFPLKHPNQIKLSWKFEKYFIKKLYSVNLSFNKQFIYNLIKW
jgi:hypothetical protein